MDDEGENEPIIYQKNSEFCLVHTVCNRFDIYLFMGNLTLYLYLWAMLCYSSSECWDESSGLESLSFTRTYNCHTTTTPIGDE